MESAKYETGKCYKIMAGSNYFSMSAADQAKFTNVFGENMFVGYGPEKRGKWMAY